MASRTCWFYPVFVYCAFCFWFVVNSLSCDDDDDDDHDDDDDDDG